MDGVSAAASIFAVLQATAEVIAYLKDVKDAPRDCRDCLQEASSLHNLLNNLLFHINQGTHDEAWYTTIKALFVEDGPIDQFKQALTLLMSKVDTQSQFQKARRCLTWKFTKGEVSIILGRIERIKSLIVIALETDHL